MAAVPPSQSNDEPQEPITTESRVEEFRRRQLRMLALNYGELAEAPSMGQVLLPFLFAAAETCWIDAIFIGLAGFGLFASHAPLVPLWTPFILIAGTQWIVSRLERRAAKAAAANERQAAKTSLPGSGWLILFISVIILLSIWATIYVPVTLFFDPRWLLALLSDVLFLNVYAYHSMAIVALSLYCCWRGIHLLARDYEPSQAFSILRLGIIIMLAVILVRVGQLNGGFTAGNDVLLLLLIPLFLFLSLSAHALARITFLRHTHDFGEINIDAQERATLGVIVALGISLLLAALLIDTLASPAALEKARAVLSLFAILYNGLVTVVSAILVLLVTPFFLLVNWLVSLLGPRHALPRAQQAQNASPVVYHPAQVATFLEPFLKIALPVLLLLVILFMVRWLVRRRRVRLITRQRSRETRESLWSWRLLWGQFIALLRALFGRFFQRAAREHGQTTPDDLPASPAARTLRQIYRALLRRAATIGYPRRHHETPSEFKERLDRHVPASEPQLGTITDAYLETRYGGSVPEEAELTRLRQAWGTLEKAWSENP